MLPEGAHIPYIYRILTTTTTPLHPRRRSDLIDDFTIPKRSCTPPNMVSSHISRRLSNNLLLHLSNFEAFSTAALALVTIKPEVTCLVWGGLRSLFQITEQYGRLRKVAEEIIQLLNEDTEVKSLERTVERTVERSIGNMEKILESLNWCRRNSNSRGIHQLQILPFDIAGTIGDGAYSNVFAAEMLPRYDKFKDAKVCTPPNYFQIEMFNK
jgi:hypothetical protein